MSYIPCFNISWRTTWTIIIARKPSLEDSTAALTSSTFNPAGSYLGISIVNSCKSYIGSWVSSDVKNENDSGLIDATILSDSDPVEMFSGLMNSNLTIKLVGFHSSKTMLLRKFSFII